MSLSVAASELYQKLWDTAVVNDLFSTQNIKNANAILDSKNRYAAVAAHFGAMPFQLVGLIHMMESSFNFNCHLYNGDPLTARTVHVPVGQPTTGNPPFSWEDSAIGALGLRGAGAASFASIPDQLHFLEAYNGFGYRHHGVNTPYLWSGTNQYTSGKFVQDGSFDPNSKSAQIGCVAVLKTLFQADPSLQTQSKI